MCATKTNRKAVKATTLIAGSVLAATLFALPTVARAQEPTTPANADPRPQSIADSNAQTTVPYNRSTSETEVRKKRWQFGPQLGMYFPTDSKTQNRFGGNWTNLGIGIGGVPNAPAQGRAAFDMYIMYNNRGDNQALLVPVGVTYRRSLGNVDGEASPNRTFLYYGGNLSAYGVDIRSKQDNVNGGLRVTAGVAPMLGLTVGRTGYIEARYLFVPEVSGFQMSGLNVTTGLRF